MIFLGEHKPDRFLARQRLAFVRGDEHQVGRFAVALECAGDLGISRSKLRSNNHDADCYCEKESWKRFHVSLILWKRIVPLANIYASLLRKSQRRQFRYEWVAETRGPVPVGLCLVNSIAAD
jgi:hypothetical protein